MCAGRGASASRLSYLHDIKYDVMLRWHVAYGSLVPLVALALSRIEGAIELGFSICRYGWRLLEIFELGLDFVTC